MPLTKLITDGMPILREKQTEAKHIAMWLVMLRRWAATQGMEQYMFGVSPEAEEGEAGRIIREHRRDALRYLNAAIENRSLAGDLFQQHPDGREPTGADCLEYIVTNWLSGQRPEEILVYELQNYAPYAEGQGLLAYLSEYSLLLKQIDPPVPSQRAWGSRRARTPNGLCLREGASRCAGSCLRGRRMTRWRYAVGKRG